MDKNAIKRYAVWARNELIERVTQKALQYGITEKDMVDLNADSINGNLLTEAEKKQRQALIAQVKEKGFVQVMEEVAYTWFNRFSGLRFMEVNGYLPTHVRVFTDEENNFKPQILSEAIHLELDGLDMEKVYSFKESDKTEELYKYLLITQCNALNSILPGVFQKISDYTELLLPENLLRKGSVIEQMIKLIPEDNFDINSENGQLEIIGWLYQYYISEKHDEVVDPLHGKIITKEEIPAATQLFTTDWVVRYIIDNSLGRYWIERNPKSNLKDELEYLATPISGAIQYLDEKIMPQELTIFDPCMGSGHFLIYAFELLMRIYEEYGYSQRDAALEIVKNNIFGLDIDDRASQLAYFSIMMKARQYDRRFFGRKVEPHVFVIKESYHFDRECIDYFVNENKTIKAELQKLIDALIDGKEFGSIIQMPKVDFKLLYERMEEIQNEYSLYRNITINLLLPFIKAAEIMSKKYVVVATNPPYLNKYDNKLKKYVTDHYKDYSGDLFSIFIYRNFDFCKEGGYSGFMTPFVWMFIKTYENLRNFIISNKSITTLVQMEYSAYEEATVPICAFVLQNKKNSLSGLYYRLADFKGGMEVQKEKILEAQKNKHCGYYFEEIQEKFTQVPGAPIAFWISDKMRNSYIKGVLLSTVASPKQGMATADNDRFVRKWYEPSLTRISFNARMDYKWFPYNNGGGFRKWYGFNTDVVNWENGGRDIKSFSKAYVRNERDYFKIGITWNAITSSDISVRYFGEGFIFSNAGMAVFTDGIKLKHILGFMNSKVAKNVLKAISPTLNYNAGDICNLPLLLDKSVLEKTNEVVEKCINISKKDWDSFEISWDFVRSPLICGCKKISDAYGIWINNSVMLYNQLKENEEILNSIFINSYELNNEMTPDVEEKEVSLQVNTAYRYKMKKKKSSKSECNDMEEVDIIEPKDVRMNKFCKDSICEFISYAVGCMLGRYSLDAEGLVYAGGKWDNSKYQTIQVDKDNIIPICDDEYFDDDIVNRFLKFIEEVYSKETFEDNLMFIADALGGKGNPKEVIRNYFMNDFYNDHVKMYQKRPIYWQFDSGKKNGFKCLIYMHRYQPDTIARIRTDYIHEQQARYRTAIENLEQRISNAAAGERVKLNKELIKLRDQATEIKIYEEKIHHLADQMIRIDLDDGVKANYEIFKDVLAKIK